MSSEKPKNLSASDLKNLKTIQALLETAQNLFNQLPVNVQDYITELHHEDTSLTHCLRWGSQAAEEVLEDLQKN